MTGDGRGSRHFRADKMGTTALSLPPLEVTVGGGGASLAGLEDVRVHTQAHRAAGLTPFEARFRKDAIQSFLLGLYLHEPRARYDDGIHPLRHPASLCESGRGTQIFDTTIRTGTDEDAVDAQSLKG